MTRVCGLEALARSGDVMLSQVNSIPGIKQLRLEGDDFIESGCEDNGGGCFDFLLSPLPVFPSSRLTWGQVSAGRRNSGKRLPANAEWQATALGTPEVACNAVRIGGGIGNRPPCESDPGVVANLWEWPARLCGVRTTRRMISSAWLAPPKAGHRALRFVVAVSAMVAKLVYMPLLLNDLSQSLVRTALAGGVQNRE